MSTKKSTYWSITINNPTDADKEGIQEALQKRWEITGQTEKGEKNGVIHYQIALRTPNQVRQSAVKKVFPRAHIEIANNPIALKQYVTKEETRVGELPESSEYYPTLSKYWDLIYNHYRDEWDWELEPNTVRFYGKYSELQQKWNDCPLDILDMATKALIEQGYHVETLAVNPQTRAAWKLYSKQIMIRCALKKYKKQSQEEENARTNVETQSSDEETEIQSAQIPCEEDYLND